MSSVVVTSLLTCSVIRPSLLPAFCRAPPAANGYTSAVYTYGTNAAISGSGTITATLTWVDAQGNPTANAPAKVNIRETSFAEAAIQALGVAPPNPIDPPGPAIVIGGMNAMAVPMDAGATTVTETAANGKGDPSVILPVYGWGCAISNGRHYSTVDGSSGTIVRTVNVSSSASATNSPSGKLFTSYNFTVDVLPCAHPCNERRDPSWTDDKIRATPGVLVFKYLYDSTSGQTMPNITDLGAVWCFEYVTFSGDGITVNKPDGPVFIPLPPFVTEEIPNPTIMPAKVHNGNATSAGDTFGTPIPECDKYNYARYTGIQYYRFHCDICMNDDEYQDLLGPVYIVRTIEQNRDTNLWQFVITRDGVSSIPVKLFQ